MSVVVRVLCLNFVSWKNKKLVYFCAISALFVQLMDQTETWYLQLPVKGFPERNKVSTPVLCFA